MRRQLASFLLHPCLPGHSVRLVLGPMPSQVKVAGFAVDRRGGAGRVGTRRSVTCEGGCKPDCSSAGLTCILSSQCQRTSIESREKAGKKEGGGRTDDEECTEDKGSKDSSNVKVKFSIALFLPRGFDICPNDVRTAFRGCRGKLDGCLRYQ